VNSYSPEFSIASQDVDLLTRVGEITGGQMIPAGDATRPELFTRRSTKTIPHDIWEALLLAALILLPIDVGVRRVLITRGQLTHAREWIQAILRRTAPSTVDSAASVSMAKLKDARSRVVLGDGKGDATGPPTATPVAEQRDQASTSSVSADTAEGAKPLASRLLDARRNRRE
jgi:hypothetical protein